MNRLPGFTAANSLYRHEVRYHLDADQVGRYNGQVTPQQHTACAIAAGMACNIAIMGGFHNWTKCLHAVMDYCMG